MFAALSLARTQALNAKFCYPVDGHSCVKASTSVAEETADIFPKMAKMPACKFGKGASAETKGCVDYHNGEGFTFQRAQAHRSSPTSVFTKF